MVVGQDQVITAALSGRRDRSRRAQFALARPMIPQRFHR